jgi:hypothetical protein
MEKQPSTVSLASGWYEADRGPGRSAFAELPSETLRRSGATADKGGCGPGSATCLGLSLPNIL